MVHNRTLKNGGDSIFDTLDFVFHISWLAGSLPGGCKSATICAIPKDVAKVFATVRPVSLLSDGGKLM